MTGAPRWSRSLGLARATRGAGRQAAPPWISGAVLALLLASFLLAGDRGSEPAVVVDGSVAPLDSLAGSLSVAVGLSVTWIGLVIVGTTVAWTVAYDQEHHLDDTYRGIGIGVGRRLLGSLAFTLLAAVVGVALTAIVIFTAGSSLGGWTAPTGAEPLHLHWSLAGNLILATAFWWLLAAILATALKSSTATVGALGGLTVCGLAASNFDSINPMLPTSWLGTLTGFERGDAGITSVWTSGSALSFAWDGSGQAHATVPLLLLCGLLAVALVTLVRLGGASVMVRAPRP